MSVDIELCTTAQPDGTAKVLGKICNKIYLI